MGFRQRLRVDTRRDHDAIDAIFADFDFSRPADYRRFLATHLIALDNLRGSVAQCRSRELMAELGDWIGRLRFDLGLGGGLSPGHDPGLAARYHELALSYVLLGSRLGLAVLKQRMEPGAPGTPARRTEFISAKLRSGRWHELCARLQAIPAQDPAADAIVRDARGILRHYVGSAHLAATWNEGESNAVQLCTASGQRL